MSLFPIDGFLSINKLKSSLLRWRVLAIFASLIAVLFVSKVDFSQFTTKQEIVARIFIDGELHEDHDKVNAIKRLADDDSIKAVIININSPGGTVVAAEMLFSAVRKVAEKKPVVAVLGDLAASGGYLTAVAADYIIAHNGTLTGSIGALFSVPNFVDLAHKVGVKFQVLKSGEMKAVPSMTENMSPEAQAVLQTTVNNIHEYFISLVAQRRNLSDEAKNDTLSGRIYTGRQALALSLVDEIGGEDDAVAWLEKEKSITAKLKTVNITPSQSSFSLLDNFLNKRKSTAEMAQLFLEQNVNKALAIWMPGEMIS